MPRTSFKASVGLAAVIFTLAACGGSSATTGAGTGAGAGGGTGASAPPVQANPGGSTAPSSSSAPGASAAPAVGGALSTLNLRIANFMSQTGIAGPALDIYDDALNPATPGGPAPQPLVSNLAFGAVSAYFHPHVPANGGYIHLSALKAGSDPVADVADAAGFFVGANDNAQATIVLTYGGQGALSATAPLSTGSISFSTLLEKGGGATFSGAVASPEPAGPAGDGMFLADDANLPGNLAGSNYLMIDDSCAPALNGPSGEAVPHIFASDSATVQSAFALFPAAAGSHQVSVVNFSTGTEPTCKDLAPKQGAITVQLTAGEEALTYVYGTSATDLHLVIAPIAP